MESARAEKTREAQNSWRRTVEREMKDISGITDGKNSSGQKAVEATNWGPMLHSQLKGLRQAIKTTNLRITFFCLYLMALSMIKSSVPPKASLSFVSDLRGSMRHVLNSSTEFASFASSSTSGLS